MGVDTCLRFKGFVKSQFKSNFSFIALNGEWANAEDEIIRHFGSLKRSCLIPTGSLSYMPSEWEDNGHATEGFERRYEEDTGFWSFQCSLKNYDNTIEEFFKIVPYFIYSVDHAEVYNEEWTHSVLYEMKDGLMTKVNSKFIQYKGSHNHGFDNEVKPKLEPKCKMFNNPEVALQFAKKMFRHVGRQVEFEGQMYWPVYYTGHDMNRHKAESALDSIINPTDKSLGTLMKFTERPEPPEESL